MPLNSFGEFELDEKQKALLDTLPADQRSNVLQKMEQASMLEGEIQDTFESGPTTLKRPEERVLSKKEQKEYEKKSKNWIYGYELFRKAPTTFVPAAENIPVPDDYVLGPGDKINIEVFGSAYSSKAQYLSRNGAISIPKLGPVTISGLTLKEARELVLKRVSEGLIGTDVFLSLGELRSINIYILGAAYQPGSYTVSSLATVTNALFVSGGVNEGGSLRNIEIKRQGKVVKNFDLYELILKGDTSSDVRLKEGDVIFIPFLDETARSNGFFNNASLFEIKETDTVEDLIFFSGGLKVEASVKPKFELSRINENGKRVRIEFGLSSSVLQEKIQDGDNLSVHSVSTTKNLVIELKGQFKYPGFYNISETETLSSVIERAGGLTKTAYPIGATFTRNSVAKRQKLSFERSADFVEQSIADTLIGGSIVQVSSEALAPISNLISRLRELEPPGRQTIEADPYVLKSNPELDIYLEDGDVLYVPQRPNSVTVVGEVRTPSTHTFLSGDSSQKYIEKSGGVLDSADPDGLFLLLPNGESREIRGGRFFSKSGSNEILPGSTIVVPRDPRPFDWLVMTKNITPILAESATVIATIKALSDND